MQLENCNSVDSNRHVTPYCFEAEGRSCLLINPLGRQNILKSYFGEIKDDEYINLLWNQWVIKVKLIQYWVVRRTHPITNVHIRYSPGFPIIYVNMLYELYVDYIVTKKIFSRHVKSSIFYLCTI